MKEILERRISQLLCVKSIVTLMLTTVFAVLAIHEKLSQDFMTIYTVIVAFYFGTQIQKSDMNTRGRDADGNN